jgi:hypothetical protein
MVTDGVQVQDQSERIAELLCCCGCGGFVGWRMGKKEDAACKLQINRSIFQSLYSIPLLSRTSEFMLLANNASIPRVQLQ